MKIVKSSVVHDWYIEGLGHFTVMCGMCGSPCLAGLGQHLPPAVAQQYLHVPGLLQCGGQSLPTECIVVCVCMYTCRCVYVCACVCVCVCAWICVGEVVSGQTS